MIMATAVVGDLPRTLPLPLLLVPLTVLRSTCILVFGLRGFAAFKPLSTAEELLAFSVVYMAVNWNPSVAVKLQAEEYSL